MNRRNALHDPEGGRVTPAKLVAVLVCCLVYERRTDGLATDAVIRRATGYTDPLRTCSHLLAARLLRLHHRCGRACWQCTAKGREWLDSCSRHLPTP